MPLVLVEGNLGAGKTLFLTVLSCLQKQDMRIVSNYNINVPGYEKFSIEEFINNRYDNCMILLDEGYVYLDSRISMDKRNRLMSYVLFQSRKKSVNIFITAQLKGTIDIRYRQLTNYVIHCKQIREGFRYTIYRPNNMSEWATTVLTFEKAKPFMGKYDTNEIIEDDSIPEGAFLTKDERNKKIVELGEQILQIYEKEFEEKYPDAKNIKKIPKAYISNYIRFNNLDSDYAKEIYEFLRSIV